MEFTTDYGMSSLISWIKNKELLQLYNYNFINLKILNNGKNNCKKIVALSEKESQQIEGGIVQFLIGAIIGGFIYDCFSEPVDCIKRFCDGMNNGLK